MNDLNLTPVAAAAGALPHHSAGGQALSAAPRLVDGRTTHVDMQAIMKRLYLAASANAQKAWGLGVAAAAKLMEMMKALWNLLVAVLRRIANRLGTRAGAPSGEQLTDAALQGEEPSQVVLGQGRAAMESMRSQLGGDHTQGQPLLSPRTLEEAGELQASAPADGAPEVPLEVVAGVLEEKAHDIAEHLAQPGRPDLSMLSDPATATEWADLSLEQLEQVRDFHDEQIHVRREEMEKLVTAFAVSEGHSTQAVRSMLSSPTGGAAIDPQGRYRELQSWIDRAIAEKSTVEMTMKAILSMPAASALPRERLEALQKKLRMATTAQDQPESVSAGSQQDGEDAGAALPPQTPRTTALDTDTHIAGATRHEPAPVQTGPTVPQATSTPRNEPAQAGIRMEKLSLVGHNAKSMALPPASPDEAAAPGPSESPLSRAASGVFARVVERENALRRSAPKESALTRAPNHPEREKMRS